MKKQMKSEIKVQKDSSSSSFRMLILGLTIGLTIAVGVFVILTVPLSSILPNAQNGVDVLLKKEYSLKAPLQFPLVFENDKHNDTTTITIKDDSVFITKKLIEEIPKEESKDAESNATNNTKEDADKKNTETSKPGEVSKDETPAPTETKTTLYEGGLHLGKFIKTEDNIAIFEKGSLTVFDRIIKISSPLLADFSKDDKGNLSLILENSNLKSGKEEKLFPLIGTTFKKTDTAYFSFYAPKIDTLNKEDEKKAFNPLGLPMDAANFYAKNMGRFKSSWSYLGRDLEEGLAFYTGGKFITLKFLNMPNLKIGTKQYINSNGDILTYGFDGNFLKGDIEVQKERGDLEYRFELSSEYDYKVNPDKSLSILTFNESKINMTEDCSKDYRERKEKERSEDKAKLSEKEFQEKYGRLSDIKIPYCNDQTAIQNAKNILPKDTEITKFQAPFVRDSVSNRYENAKYQIEVTGSGESKKTELILFVSSSRNISYPIHIDTTLNAIE